MLRSLRHRALQLLKSAGIFHLAKNSEWRRQRLLILCYHGIALEEEYKWMPSVYMRPELFERRLQTLRDGQYNVLPLATGIEGLYRGNLAPRSVAITFDDGMYDFLSRAFPLLKDYGFPATVYQTTYYCDYAQPIFHLICSYMLWKRRGLVLKGGQNAGIPERLDLRTANGRGRVLESLVTFAQHSGLSEAQKGELAASLGTVLKVDYSDLLRKRVLQLMRPEEISKLASDGIDFQLHTHRHRTPLDEALFVREIRDNRSKLREMISAASPSHFCYPSGEYHLEFLPWLEKEGIVSATTCEQDLASSEDSPFLLPRFIDTTGRTLVEFEAWLAGIGPFAALPRRRYKPPRPERFDARTAS